MTLLEHCHGPRLVSARTGAVQVVTADSSNSDRRQPLRDNNDLAVLCEPVARLVWGEPNGEAASELRWGTRGSRVVDRAKGVWYDHERSVGGGTLDLVPGATRGDRLQWLRDRGLVNSAQGEARKSKNGKVTPLSIIATYDYTDESGTSLFQVVRLNPKDFRQRRSDGRGGWIWSLGSAPRVLYRLPEVRDAVVNGRLVIIAEGEKDVDNLRKLGFTATCNLGGANKWRAENSESLRGADTVIVGDNDDSGRAHVVSIASSLQGVARRVRVLDLVTAWPECPTKGDVSNWIEASGTAEALAVLIEALPEWTPPVSNDSDQGASELEFNRLAELTWVQYDLERAATAKRLGIRTSTLDGLVEDARTTKHPGEGLLSPHWNVEPHSEQVETARLLQAIFERIKSHVVLSDEGAVAVTLWTAVTWVHERAATHSPILMVTSAEANSGKSTLLGLVGFLARRSLLSVGISAAALYRSIQKWQPTFVIDEADKIFILNEELREAVNSGWTRGQGVVRCHPETHEPCLFSTFCPKAIGLKGRKLPDTTFSRSIVVEIQRKLPSDPVAEFRHLDDDGLALLRQYLARWADDYAPALADAAPTMPDGFINRAAANWRLLLAIADLAESGWPERARKAAKALSGSDTSQGIRLLSDIRDLFIEKKSMRSRPAPWWTISRAWNTATGLR